MVISWLLNSLSKDIADTMLYSKTAKDIWTELEARFGQCNGAQLYQLQKELSELVQGNSDVAGYYTKLKKIWDEQDTLNTRVVCSCDCSCGGKEKTLKSLQDGRLIQFLMGLNDTYGGVKSSILMMSPLPNVNQAYSLLIQDEKQREIHVGVHPAESAFLKPGHTLDKCYRIVGFPPDFKFTKPRKFQGNAHSNATISEDFSINTTNGAEGTSSGKGLTQEQHSQLFQLLQQVKISPQSEQNSEAIVNANCAGIDLPNLKHIICFSHVYPNTWIIDSGASEHMTSDISILFNIISLSIPLYINLPNSHKIKVGKKGSVHILPGLTIHNVLYVPVFKFNLLSVHKLTKHLRCNLLFTYIGTILQGPSMKRPVVVGEVMEGLYILNPKFISTSLQFQHQSSFQPTIQSISVCNNPSKTNVSDFVSCLVNLSKDVSLWHKRLGHMPLSSMGNLSMFQHQSLSKLNSPCDVCSKARQSKLPFHPSSISSTSIFELIHIDTWAPYKAQTHDGFKYFFTIVDDFSRGTWTYLLKTKSNAFSVLKSFFAMVERQLNTQVKIVRSDNAMELVDPDTLSSEFITSSPESVSSAPQSPSPVLSHGLDSNQSSSSPSPARSEPPSPIRSSPPLSRYVPPAPQLVLNLMFFPFQPFLQPIKVY
ncbi:PREDICTED: uncharacterized protein LOC109242112 [Nicotiana attenuata]|uniref:uncharacterized protein LOC109242112 n=1 Tax=Nicotiana attenuata TaxID=49451 RepID=UPI0009051720|nr:PREDICTED: uncharacterized protein LOC109242112 [Nicotiana attenuata]